MSLHTPLVSSLSNEKLWLSVRHRSAACNSNAFCPLGSEVTSKLRAPAAESPDNAAMAPPIMKRSTPAMPRSQATLLWGDCAVVSEAAAATLPLGTPVPVRALTRGGLASAPGGTARENTSTALPLGSV